MTAEFLKVVGLEVIAIVMKFSIRLANIELLFTELKI